MNGLPISPFGIVVEHSELGTFGNVVGENNGESEGVYELRDHPGLLAKIYKKHLVRPGDGDRLDRLVSLPTGISDDDRQLLASTTSWPMSRIVDRGSTSGTVLPMAPKEFLATLQVGPRRTRTQMLEIDWLVQPASKYRPRGLPVPTFTERLRICQNIVAVADFLERNSLVYGDWSYANAFWSIHDHRAYVIDLDGCSFGPRQRVASPNWEDPLTPPGASIDTYSDRYGAALLVARCLTGKRDRRLALDAFREVTVATARPGLNTVVWDMVNANSRTQRPPVAALLDELQRSVAPGIVRTNGTGSVPASGVVGWTLKEQLKPTASAQKPAVRPPVPRGLSTGPQPSRPQATPVKPPMRPRRPRVTVTAAFWICVAIVVVVWIAVHQFI
ncbi:MAG: hypothetical protein ACRDQ4_01940 [Pseudonocardiaceae bacterium]